MKKYHFIFKYIGEKVATGINIEATDAPEAMKLFVERFTDKTFVAMYSIEDASALLHHQIEQADKFPTPELFINSSSQAVEQEGIKENE